MRAREGKGLVQGHMVREGTSREKILASRMPLSGDLWDTYFEHLKLTFPSLWASFSAWRPSPARDLPRPAQSCPAPAPVQATTLSSCLVWKLPDPFPQPGGLPRPPPQPTTRPATARKDFPKPALLRVISVHTLPRAPAAPGEMRALRPTAGSHLGHPPASSQTPTSGHTEHPSVPHCFASEPFILCPLSWSAHPTPLSWPSPF